MRIPGLTARTPTEQKERQPLADSSKDGVIPANLSGRPSSGRVGRKGWYEEEFAPDALLAEQAKQATLLLFGDDITRLFFFAHTQAFRQIVDAAC